MGVASWSQKFVEGVYWCSYADTSFQTCTPKHKSYLYFCTKPSASRIEMVIADESRRDQSHVEPDHRNSDGDAQN